MSKERIAGLIFLFIGIYVLILSAQLPFGGLRLPGAGMYPLSLSILLCISGISWFIQGKRKGKEVGKGVRTDWSGLIRKVVTPLKILGITGVFILTLNRLGYLATSFLYIFLLFLLVSRYRMWKAAGFAAVLGVGSWLFFQKLLKVQLPLGLFGL